MAVLQNNSRIIWLIILLNIGAAALVVILAEEKITIYLLAFTVGIVTKHFFSRFC